MSNTIKYNGKVYYYDSTKSYKEFKKRLTILRKVHPRMKYKFYMEGTGKKTKFKLYVRKWGV